MAEVVEQEKELKSEALTVQQQVQLVKVVDQPSYDNAAHLLIEVVKPMRKRWFDYWEPLRKQAYDVYDGILQKKADGDKPLEAAERQLKSAILTWDQEQERIRQAAQRKAQEEAERLERERNLAAAVAAEQAGADEEQVTAIMEAPPVAVAPVLAPSYQRAAGVSSRDHWVAEVTDIKALCRAIAAGKASTEFVMPNQSALDKTASALKLTMAVPGVIARNKPILAGRTK